MRTNTAWLLMTCLLLAGTLAQAEAPAYVGRYRSTSEDRQALQQVLRDFQSAVAEKDLKRLTSLLLHTDIHFVSPATQQAIDSTRGSANPGFNGHRAGGFYRFAEYVAAPGRKVQERSYNARITQDGPLAVILFAFDLLEGEEVKNHGLEVWQLSKVDGKWKLFSVAWSSHGPPHAPAPGR